MQREVTPTKRPAVHSSLRSKLWLLLPSAALLLSGCGSEGNRAPVCGQEGAVCEVVGDTESPGDDDGNETEGDDDDDDTSGDHDDDAPGSDGSAGDDDDDATTGGDDDDDDDDDTTGGDDDDDDGLGEPPAGFPEPQPFGDSVLETDLIGIWTLPTDGSTVGFSQALEITAEGRFEWREYNDVCDLTQHGAGWIWVEGSQLVMVFGQWDGPAPWPVQAKYGWDAEAPFMLRVGYAPVLGRLGLTLPPGIREAVAWTGRGFTRTVGGGNATDVWVAEVELWAVTPGYIESDIVVRDRTTFDMSLPGTTGTATFNRWWFEDGEIDPEVPSQWPLSFFDDDLGHVEINGNDHVYLGNKMSTWEPGDNFLLGGDILCE